MAKAKYQQIIPPDLRGLRNQQLGLLQSLLGLGGGGFGGAGGGQGGGGWLNPFNRGATGAGLPNFEQFFGQLGSPATPLQRQSTDAISAFLNQPAPEQRAMDISMPALQAILAGAPGQGIIGALQPQFQRNLASANQQGGRFGSANAIMRSRALEDFNLLGAQAAQQGIQQQMQAAQVLGLLGQQAGQNPFSRMMGAFGVGQQGAQQADLETQRRMQLLMTLLSTAQQTAFNLPIAQTGTSKDLGDWLIPLGSAAISRMPMPGGGG